MAVTASVGGNVRNTAWVFMLAATAGYALLPLTFEQFGTINAPLLAAGLIEIVSSFVILGYLYYIIRRSETVEAYKAARGAWDNYKARRFRAFKSGYTWVIAVSQLQWLMFLWSAQFIETAVTTILFETWPLWFVLFMASGPTITYNVRQYSFRAQKLVKTAKKSIPITAYSPKHETTITSQNNKITFDRFIFIMVGFAGLVFIVISQTERITNQGSSELSTLLIGLMLAILAGIMTGSSEAASTLSGTDLLTEASISDKNDLDIDLFKSTASLLYTLIARVILGVVLLAIFAVSNILTPTTVTLSAFWGSLISGTISGIGFILLIWAYHKAPDPAIAAVYYLTPVFAICLLWLFTDVVLERPDMFWLGVIAILIGNIFLQFDPDAGATQQLDYSVFGFRSFVVALWAFGSFVVLRDNMFPDFVAQWNTSEYWGLLSVCAVIFVLILSFRINRLNDRERHETNEFLYLHRHAEHYYHQKIPGLDDLSLQQELRNLDSSRKMKDIARSYFRCHKIVESAYAAAQNNSSLPPKETTELTKSLIDFRVRLDKLANERQTGRDFAELAALGSFAALTIGVALFAKPWQPPDPVSGWPSFVTEIVVIVFSATILFLCVNLVDRRRHRDSPRVRSVSKSSINKYGQIPGWRLNFWVYDNLISDRVMSSVLGLAVMAAIAVILGYKWF